MRTLMALALLFSSSAFACPDLTGKFTCMYQDKSTEDVTISQEMQKDGTFVYNYNGTMIPADGKIYDVPDDAQVKEGKFKAFCDDDITLKTTLVGKYWRAKAYFGDLILNMNFTVEKNDLKQNSVGSVKNSSGEYPLNSALVCVRMK